MKSPIAVKIPVSFPDIEDLVNGTNLKADKMRVFLHQIYLSRLNQIGYDTESSSKMQSWLYKARWVPLHSALLKQLLTCEYTKYRDFLEKKGLLFLRETSSSEAAYTPGHMSIHYTIPEGLFHAEGQIRHFRSEMITDLRTIKAILRVRDRYAIKVQPKHLKLEPIHEALLLMEKTVRFDIVKAESWFRSHPNENSEILELLGEINSGVFSSSVDLFGERFHTPLKRCKGELRQYMYFEGRTGSEIMSIDFCNSQLYFSTLLTNTEVVKKMLPEFLPIIGFANRYSSEPDFLLYIDQCCKGTIYSYWQDLRNHPNRDTAKAEMIGVLFCGNKSKQSGVKEFKEHFPSVAKFFWHIKALKEDELPFIKSIYIDHRGRREKGRLHRNLSCATQKLESRMIIKQISVACINKNIGPFFTIHDSVFCLKEGVDTTVQIIKDEFQKIGLRPPALKIKSVTNSEMLLSCSSNPEEELRK